MTRDKLQEKTVAELHEMAAKKGVAGHHQMNKDDLVDALADNGETANDKPAKASQDKDRPETPQKSGIGVNIIGEAGSGKDQKRLFQTGPETKEYLSKEEARQKGFFWKDLEGSEDPAKSDKTTLRA